jgi:hypothetical protein
MNTTLGEAPAILVSLISLSLIWRAVFRFSNLRCKPIGSIGVDDVLSVLNPIWQKVPETARRLRMRVERVLDAAKVKGLRSGENPARLRGHLDYLLPKHPKSSKGHHGALAFQKTPQFMASLSQMESISARALEFAVLTSARDCPWLPLHFHSKVQRVSRQHAL